MRRGPDHTEPTFSLAPTAPWERVGIDFIGPLPETEKGNKYIITAINYFTKWPEARAVPAATAQVAVEFLYEEIVCRYGLVKYFHRSEEHTSELQSRVDM